MSGRRTRLLIFDLDGTLVDSFPGIRLGLNRALEENGLPAKDLAWVKDNVGWGVRRLMAAAVGNEARVDVVLTSFFAHYTAVLNDNTPPYPGVDEMLANVAGSHDLAIASNKPLAMVDSLVDHLGWRSMMAVVVAPETAGAHKPDPAMIHEILWLTGHSAAQALLIGDMPVDAETGRNAGIPVIGVTTGNADKEALLESGCIAVLNDVCELPEWLAPLGYRSS